MSKQYSKCLFGNYSNTSVSSCLCYWSWGDLNTKIHLSIPQTKPTWQARFKLSQNIIASTFSQPSHESSTHTLKSEQPLFIFHRGYCEPEHTWTKNNIIALWLNTLLLKPRESLLAFSQVRTPPWCSETSTIFTWCSVSEASALCIFGQNFLKTTGRCSRVSGFNFLWKFPDVTVTVWTIWKHLNKWGVSFQGILGALCVWVYVCKDGKCPLNQRGSSANLELSQWPLSSDSQPRNALCATISSREEERSPLLSCTFDSKMQFYKVQVCLTQSGTFSHTYAQTPHTHGQAFWPRNNPNLNVPKTWNFPYSQGLPKVCCTIGIPLLSYEDSSSAVDRETNKGHPCIQFMLSHHAWLTFTLSPFAQGSMIKCRKTVTSSVDFSWTVKSEQRIRLIHTASRQSIESFLWIVGTMEEDENIFSIEY